MKVPGITRGNTPDPFWRKTMMAGLLFAGLPIGHAAGQERAALAEGTLARSLLSSMRNGATVEAAKKKIQRRFKLTDIDGNGVSESDYELKEKMGAAVSRARRISRFLEKDLDGDGAVSRKELRLYHGVSARKPIRSRGVQIFPTEEQIEQKLSTLVSQDMAADKDENSTVTIAEISAWADARVKSRRRGKLDRAIPLLLDKDGDGIVSQPEFTRAVDRFLKTYDRDGDEKFSSDEYKAAVRKASEYRNAVYAEQRARQKKNYLRKTAIACAFPKPPAEAKILLLGTRNGQALSTVGLGNSDASVSVSDIWIEPGDQPLFLLLASYGAMIWRFTGDTDRITHVVASSFVVDGLKSPRAGIVGVSKARVYIAPNKECLPYLIKAGKRPQSHRAAKLFASSAGRNVDTVLARGAVNSVSLPAGLFEKDAIYTDAINTPENAKGAAWWRRSLRRYPGGVVEVDAKAVVSRSTAENYEVLPGYAGLAQLIDKGALRFLDEKFPDIPRQPLMHRQKRYPLKRFLILKKIRYPAGLDSTVRFVLAPGVEKPVGSPGYSKLIPQGGVQ